MSITLRKKWIYVVEDDPEFIEILKKNIVEPSYTLDFFSTLGALSSAIQISYPDCIILDLGLGEESGIDFLKKRFDDPVLIKIPVIVLTAEFNRTVISEVMSYSVFEYLHKPLNSWLLIKALDKVFHLTHEKLIPLDPSHPSHAIVPSVMTQMNEETFKVYCPVKIDSKKEIVVEHSGLKKAGVNESSFMVENVAVLSEESHFEITFRMKGKPLPPPAATEGKFVFHLDDDPDSHILIKKIVESVPGYTYRGFTECVEFLNTTRGKRPNAFVLDLNLVEGIGVGFTVIKALRNTVAKKTPILILSGRGREQDITFGFEVGADDYLSKPVNVAAFTTKIKALLGRAVVEDATKVPSSLKDPGKITIDLKPSHVDEAYCFFESDYFIQKNAQLEVESELLNAMFKTKRRTFIVHECTPNLSTEKYLLKLVPPEADESYFSALRAYMLTWTKSQRLELNVFFKDITPGYLQRRQDELDELEKIVDARMFQELIKRFHNIAGSAGGFGLAQATAHARLIEKYAREQNFEELSREFVRYKNFLLSAELVFVAK